MSLNDAVKIKSQAKTSSNFENHSVTMWAQFASFFVMRTLTVINLFPHHVGNPGYAARQEMANMNEE